MVLTATLTLSLWCFALALLVSAIGFYRLVYFISIGYGYSILAISVAVVLWAGSVGGGQIDTLLVLHAFVLAAYGARLGTYLLLRERARSFAAEKADIEEQNRRATFWKKVAIWVGVALLYVAMASPLMYRAPAAVALEAVATAGAAAGRTTAAGGNATALLSWIGLALAFVGLITETVADVQKSRAKKQTPDRWVDIGLFRIVRFPNYFGEMLVWLGNWVAGIPFYTSGGRWLVATGALLVIELIMIGSGKRLEEKQDTRYGGSEEYRSYCNTVPVIIPLLPVYSLKRARIYLG